MAERGEDRRSSKHASVISRYLPSWTLEPGGVRERMGKGWGRDGELVSRYHENPKRPGGDDLRDME